MWVLLVCAQMGSELTQVLLGWAQVAAALQQLTVRELAELALPAGRLAGPGGAGWQWPGCGPGTL